MRIDLAYMSGNGNSDGISELERTVIFSDTVAVAIGVPRAGSRALQYRNHFGNVVLHSYEIAMINAIM